MFKKIAIMTFLMVFLVSIPYLSSEEVKKDKPEIKTWKMPNYMVENLRNMIEKFNREFSDKVDLYKLELRERFKEFKDLPKDVVFDLESGIFISRDDFIILQKQVEAIAKIKEEEKEMENKK